jgi:prepilin-type processing-associated H-X9-DG protein
MLSERSGELLPPLNRDRYPSAWAGGFERAVTDVAFSTFYTPNTIGTGDIHSTVAASVHTRGVNACLADGSVRFVSETVDADVWRNLGDRDDGQTLGTF